jgi:uncharacterized repeat protein (TIGR01451 family)
VTKTDANSGDTYAHAFDVTGTPPGIDLSSTNSGDETLFISDSSGSDVFIGWGEDQSGTGSWDTYISKVSTVPAATWSTQIEACGGFANSHCVNNIRQIVPDTSGGAYVLAMTGDDLGGAGSVDLRHYNSAGTLTGGFPVALSTGNNSGMVADGSGGVWVLSDMGFDPAGTLGHGVVQKYTSAGAVGAPVSVSSNAVSTKSNAVMVDDGSGGAIVLWIDDSAGEQGIYGQRILSSGSLDAAWTARGTQLIASTTLSGDNIRAVRDGTNIYYTYKLTTNVVNVAQTDLTPASAWSCVQPMGTNINDYDLVTGASGVFAIWEDNSGADNGVYGQHYDETTGDSTWTVGGVLLDDAVSNSGTNFEIILKSFFSSTGDFEFTPYTTAARQTATNGFQIVYSYEKNSAKAVYSSSYTTASFAAGAGNDCSGGGGGGGGGNGNSNPGKQEQAVFVAPVLEEPIVEGPESISYPWIYTGSRQSGFNILNPDATLLQEVDSPSVRSYTREGLDHNTSYAGLNIQAYNISEVSATSGPWSDAITHIIPVTPKLVTRTGTNITLTINETVNNLELGDSGIQFELLLPDTNVTASAITQGEWGNELEHTFEGIAENQDVQARVRARNQDAIETDWSQYITISADAVEATTLSISLAARDISGQELSEVLTPEDLVFGSLSVTNTGDVDAENVFATLPLPQPLIFVPGSLQVGDTLQSEESDEDIGQAGSDISAIWAILAPGETVTVAFQLAFDLVEDEGDFFEQIRSAVVQTSQLQASASASNVSGTALSNIVEVSVDSDPVPVPPAPPVPDPTPAPVTPPPSVTPPPPPPTPDEISTIEDLVDILTESEPVNEVETSLLLTGNASAQNDLVEFTGTTSEPNSIVTITFNNLVTVILTSDENGVWQTFVSAAELGIEPGQEASIQLDGVAEKDGIISNQIRDNVQIYLAQDEEITAEIVPQVSSVSILDIPEEAEEIITTATVVTIPLVAITSIPLWGYLPYLPMLLWHLISWLLGIIGRRKKKEGTLFGIVYDSISKKPLGLSILRVFDKETNKLVATRVTDKQGRYDVLLKPGRYRLEAVKPQYVFPSHIVTSSVDGDFGHVYQKGEGMMVSEQEIVIPDVPLDPANRKSAWSAANIFKKLWMAIQTAGTFLAGPVLLIGSLSTFLLIINQPENYFNWILAGIYVVMLVLQLTFRTHPEKAWGVVYDLASSTPLPLTTIQLIDPEYGKVVKSRLTDYQGRFAFLPEPGEYLVKAQKQGYQQAEVIESPGKDFAPMSGKVSIKKEGQRIDGDIAMRQE